MTWPTFVANALLTSLRLFELASFCAAAPNWSRMPASVRSHPQPTPFVNTAAAFDWNTHPHPPPPSRTLLSSGAIHLCCLAMQYFHPHTSHMLLYPITYLLSISLMYSPTSAIKLCIFYLQFVNYVIKIETLQAATTRRAVKQNRACDHSCPLPPGQVYYIRLPNIYMAI